jgi:hypothetical protein
MKARRSCSAILATAHDCWDEPWKSGDVHMLVTCYSGSSASLEQHCQTLRQLKPAGVQELAPHQDAGLLVVKGKPDRIEHFGFADGLSNPAVESVPDNGGPGDTGNLDEKGRFREVPMGEFLLGHRGEGGEVAPMPRPRLLVRNGTYLVLRKLEQDVVGFGPFSSRRPRSCARFSAADSRPCQRRGFPGGEDDGAVEGWVFSGSVSGREGEGCHQCLHLCRRSGRNPLPWARIPGGPTRVGRWDLGAISSVGAE